MKFNLSKLFMISAFTASTAFAENVAQEKEIDAKVVAVENADDSAEFKPKKAKANDNEIIVTHRIEHSIKREPVEVYIGVFGVGSIKASSAKFSKNTNNFTPSGMIFGAQSMLIINEIGLAASESENDGKGYGGVDYYYNSYKNQPKLLNKSSKEEIDAIAEKLKIGSAFSGGIMLETVLKMQPTDERKSESPLKFSNFVFYEVPLTFSTFFGCSYFYKKHVFTLAAGFGIANVSLPNEKYTLGNGKQIEIQNFESIVAGLGAMFKYDYNITEHFRTFSFVQFMGYGIGNVVKIGLGVSHFVY